MSFTKFILSCNTRFTRSHLCKNIHVSSKRPKRAYDAEGKTRVDILDAQRIPDIGLIVESYSQVGFRLSNRIHCMGPIILFSRSVLSWNVTGPYDITAESLSLFYKLEPKLDILVLGIGDSLDRRQHIEKSIYNDLVKKCRINVEILKTEHACATYNFLCTEHRLVAGAFIPPRNIFTNDQDVIDAKIRQNLLYSCDSEENEDDLIDYDKIKQLEDKKNSIKAPDKPPQDTKKKST